MKLFRTKRVSSPEDGRTHFDRLYIVDLPWFGVLLHHLQAPDHDRDMHDHPWNFWSFVLWGRYDEVVPWDGSWSSTWWDDHPRLGRIALRHIRWFNRKRADRADPHRISYVAPHTWTLCFRGPKRRDWGFHTERGWVPHGEYLA